jgi:hypothetical protein
MPRSGIEQNNNCIRKRLNIQKEKGKMRKSTRSILQELSDLGISRDKDHVVESRGTNLIESAINLLSLIRENYDLETAAELERRFINAIRTAEPAKFKRGMKKIQESRDDT